MDERFNDTAVSDTLFHRYIKNSPEVLSSVEFQNIVNYHIKRGPPRFSEAAIRAWLQKYPDNREPAWMLAQLLNIKGRSGEALDIVEKLETRDSNNPQIKEFSEKIKKERKKELSSYLLSSPG